jgi:ectoine hydroxylase-related dioxygenase (phytanoyl-CoA dioxygenase family)
MGPQVDESDRVLAAEAVEAYQRDGAICVRGALDAQCLDGIAADLEANMSDPGPWSCEYTPDGAPGRFWDDYCNWQRFDGYRAALAFSSLPRIAAVAMQSRTARIFHEHVLVKEAGTSEVTPWHHDQPYYCIDGDQCLSIWVPLDPVPLASSLRFVAGSHHGQMYAPKRFMDHESYGYGSGWSSVPDIDAELEDHSILQWELEPGDCIVFHMRALHAATGSSRRRRVFSARYVGDDIRYAHRPAPTSPPFPEVAAVLSPGDPLDHPTFPLVVG